MVVVGDDVGNFSLYFIEAPTINVSHRNHVDVRDGKNLLEQILSAIADANHSHPDAIVSAKYARRWISQKSRCSDRSLLQKPPPRAIHFGVISHRSAHLQRPCLL